MSEYIERKDVEKAIADIRGIYRKARNFNAVSAIDNAAGEIRECVKNADVAPVVHGQWVHSPSPYDKRDDFWFCSECGRTINIICGDKLLSNYPYCHCGAKMDGEELQNNE